MAIRTTEESVKATAKIDNNLWNEVYISDASIIVDRLETCAVDEGTPLTTAELEAIERYLTIHLYALNDQGKQYKSKKTGEASASFWGIDGKGLEKTEWGRHAITMDRSGCLTKFGSLKKAAVHHLGIDRYTTPDPKV